MKSCTAAIGALTATIKAKRVLDDAKTDCRIVKLDPSSTKRGCSYGIEYFCEDHKAVRSAFNVANISVSVYLKGGGGEMV